MTAIPAQNQTVEEILASIRAAITDDEVKRGGIARAAVAPAATIRPAAGKVSGFIAERDEDDDGERSTDEESDAQGVIDMAIEKAIDGVKAELGTADADRRPSASLGMRDGQPGRPRATNARPVEPSPMPSPRPSRPLLSARTGAAVSASFGDLARTMTQGSTRPLDQIVEDMLRPMLRTWLDDNLPLLVERLVREEIERVSRGR